MTSSTCSPFQKKESSLPFFHYMRQSHPAWTHNYPCWNGRYLQLLSSVSTQVQEARRDAFFVEGRGYDRSLLRHLIPHFIQNVHKVGFNGTKLLLHLGRASTSPSGSSSSSCCESFQSRFSRRLKSKPIQFPPSHPEDVSLVSDELDMQIQGLHLRHFLYLCRKVRQASLKQRKTTSMFMVGPLVDRHFARLLVCCMDPQISPVLPHRTPDGKITFTRREKAKPDQESAFCPPPLEVNDDERRIHFEELKRRFISLGPIEDGVQFVVKSLSLCPPTLNQLYAIAREYLVKAPEGENTSSSLLKSPILVFPFRMMLKELYYELAIINEVMREKICTLKLYLKF